MPGTGNSVVDAILAGTKNLEVRESMLVGSWYESSWNPTAVGDNGTSFGPFQMHIGGALSAAGGTPAQAENPSWAVSAMLPAYEQAVSSISQAEWNSNPALAAEQAAVAAERPAQSYLASYGQGSLNQAWTATQGALAGHASSPGAPNGGTSTTGATLTSVSLPFPGGNADPLNWPFSAANAATNTIGQGITSAVSSLGEAFLKAIGISSVKDLFIRAGLIILGTLLILIGISQFLKTRPVSDSSDDESETDVPAPVPTETGTSDNMGERVSHNSRKRSPVSRSKPATRTGAGTALKTVGKEAAEMAVVA